MARFVFDSGPCKCLVRGNFGPVTRIELVGPLLDSTSQCQHHAVGGRGKEGLPSPVLGIVQVKVALKREVDLTETEWDRCAVEIHICFTRAREREIVLTRLICPIRPTAESFFGRCRGVTRCG